MHENRLDEQKLKQAIEINAEEDFKSIEEDDAKPNLEKDTIGYWTDKQIEESPEAYIRYLKAKLKSATVRQDLEEIKDLILKISEINKKYFNNNDYLEQGKVR